MIFTRRNKSKKEFLGAVSDNEEFFEEKHAYVQSSTSSRDSSDSDILGDLAPLALEHRFQNKDEADHWLGIYTKVGYEGLEQFDPDFTWTKQEERKVLWATELRVCFVAFLMFVALDIDRFNVTNATAGTLLEDLNMTTNDFNLGSTITLVCFLCAELPSQLLSKKIGPDRWIPAQLVLWSLVATFQSFVKNRGGFFACRALLGLLQGGFIPDVTLWMSYFYTTSEMSTRLGFFYVANPITQAFSSLLSYAIFFLHGHAGWAGWRWVFLIEGLITLCVGILSIFLLTPSVTQTKSWFCPKGWYTDRQAKIMVNRVLRDDPSKGDMHNREGLTLRMLWKSILEFDLWPICICRLFADLSGAPVSKYQAILFRSQGFSTLRTNLLMIPPNILATITLLATVFLSKFTRQYASIMAITPIWWLPCLVAMRWWPGFLHDVWGSYILLFIALGVPLIPAMANAWISANSFSVRSRTISGALVNISGQLAYIIGANIFRADDAPRYRRGLGQLVAICIAAICCPFLAKLYYIMRNRWKRQKWASMSIEEQGHYMSDQAETAGNKRLDFMFAH